MGNEKRLIGAAAGGLLLLTAGVAADLLFRSFWVDHALLTGLVASIVVLVVTVVVVNEAFARRDRQRWQLLAQAVMFALAQSARATWTGLAEVLHLCELQGGGRETLDQAAAAARDPAQVTGAIDAMLADPQRRELLQRASAGLRDYTSGVIAAWAPVMIGARPYAEVIDRHVELASRMDWLANVLAHQEPLAGQSTRERVLARSSLAGEHAARFGSDAALRAMLTAVLTLALELDEQSQAYALSIVPFDWWLQRTEGLSGTVTPSRAPGAPPAAPVSR